MERLFIALELPASAVQALCLARDELSARAQGRFVPDAQLHITLWFLGDADAAGRRAALAALAAGASASGPLQLRLGPCGFFGPRHSPGVWAQALGAQQGFLAVQSAMESVLAPAGYPREERAFRPHVTLGRRVAWPAGAPLPAPSCAFAAEWLTLQRSTLLPGGPQYDVVARERLRGVSG